MGINLNGTSGGIVLNGTRDPGLEKAIADLELNKVDKENGKGLSANDYTDDDKAEVAKIKDKQDKLVFDDYPKVHSTNPVTSHGLYITEDDLNQKIARNSLLIGEMESTKADKAVYYNPTAAGAITYDLKNEHNRMTSYIGADAATSVTISVSNGAYRNDYISGLSFYTGSTAPEVSYPASPYTMRWIGSECVTSGSNSVFSPIANRVYDIIFYFNGGYIVGLVNGYDDIPQQGA